MHGTVPGPTAAPETVRDIRKAAYAYFVDVAAGTATSDTKIMPYFGGGRTRLEQLTEAEAQVVLSTLTGLVGEGRTE